MRDQGIWSISLGTWGGVPVRLHGLFLLFAVFTAYLAWLYVHPWGAAAGAEAADAELPVAWLAVTSLVVLFIGVLAHELGHVFTAIRVGGQAEDIVLGPWGGLTPMQLPLDARAELATSLAGPLVNFLFAWALCFPILVVHAVPVATLLNPLAPEGLLTVAPDGISVEWLTLVKLAFWINWLLFLVNLIPVFPFDGGHILQASMLWFWPELNRRWTAIVVSRLARLGAVLLLVAAWLARDEEATGPVPAWLALAMLAGLIYFSARKRETAAMDEHQPEPTPAEFEFSEDYSSLGSSYLDEEETTIQANERWTQRRKAAQQRRQQELEAEDDRRMDEVLARLHEVGLANLPEADRDLLRRMSERYRSRQNRSSRP